MNPYRNTTPPADPPPPRYYHNHVFWTGIAAMPLTFGSPLFFPLVFMPMLSAALMITGILMRDRAEGQGCPHYRGSEA